MQNTLRKTLIKLDESTELQFYKIAKFTRFGCKAMFFDPSSMSSKKYQKKSNIYDVTVLSKSLLQLNSLSEQIMKNLQEYKNMNSNIGCSVYSVTEDGDIIYIISKGQKDKLSDLVEKREGLTEFQIIYFLLNLIQIMNHLKSYKFFYQVLELDEIYLTPDMKLLIPFSIWTCSTMKIKPMALRHQDKKSYIAPELLSNNTDISADQVNAWNVGVFIYELVEGVKPFLRNTLDLTFNRQVSTQIVQLLQKLMKRNLQERLKFPLILLQNLFKKYSSIPHILPGTIFSCPPSNEFISQYCNKFEQKPNQKPDILNKVLNVQTAHFIPDLDSQNSSKNQVFSFKSTKYIKPSDRSITQSRSYITEFVDISDVFGYGYQMNTGLICFVFNDGTKMYFENSLKKTVSFVTQKDVTCIYIYQKIPEESEIKKKLFVLEAYVKSIKKFKHSTITQTKNVIVSQYFKTNSAAVFLLSNQTIEIIFNDKMIFMLTKHKIHIQNKNSDRFESYESLQETSDLLVRKKYALAMAEKLFHWQTTELQKVKSKVQAIAIKQGNNHNQNENHGWKNFNILLDD